MNHPHSPLHRSLLILASTALLFAAACNKKPKAAAPAPPPPAPVAAKPTVSMSADRISINRGESAKLSWTTTDATNVSITPEVGAVTAQGSTTVTPADSTTYAITASGPGGSTDANVRITVNVPAPVAETPKGPSYEELFMREVRDAYFDLDKADIRPDARIALEKTAAFL
jgi:peptidoglycan-associated lipoprotein